jgi:hypothetical protein
MAQGFYDIRACAGFYIAAWKAKEAIFVRALQWYKGVEETRLLFSIYL